MTIPAHVNDRMRSMATVRKPDDRPNPRCPACGEPLYDESQTFGWLTFYTADGRTVVIHEHTQEILPFSNAEAAILSVMAHAKGRVITKDKIYDTLYWMRGESDAPESKIVDVYICKIRKRIRALSLPLTVHTLWGRGYSLEFT